jgi:DNA-directed RNA polymerase subunit RPC12/RpoP
MLKRRKKYYPVKHFQNCAKCGARVEYESPYGQEPAEILCHECGKKLKGVFSEN